MSMCIAPKSMRIYISGAITGTDRGLARVRFAAAAAVVAALGHTPVDPFDIPNDPDCGCPGDPARLGPGHTWACCLRKDIRVLVDLDAILMLRGDPQFPDWTTSHGARLELQVAAAVGLTVFSSLEEIPDVSKLPA